MALDSDDASCNHRHHHHHQHQEASNAELGDAPKVQRGTSIHAAADGGAAHNPSPAGLQEAVQHVKHLEGVDGKGVGAEAAGTSATGVLGKLKRAALHGANYDIHKVVLRIVHLGRLLNHHATSSLARRGGCKVLCLINIMM